MLAGCVLANLAGGISSCVSERERRDDTERFSRPYGGMYSAFALSFCVLVPTGSEAVLCGEDKRVRYYVI